MAAGGGGRVGFEPGRMIVRRQFHRGQLIGRVWVGRVVADDERGLCLWIADGAAFQDVGAADGRSFREVPFAQWPGTAKRLHLLRWSTSMLMVHPPGADYSLWLFFDGDGRFRNWYVNLERPVVRWDDGALAGLDTLDYDLDIVVAPDRSWRWKDEDEFAHHLAHPEVYWCEDERAVRAEGERLVGLIEAGRFPFDGSWCDFAPDPGWPVPGEVPAGWDRPRAW
jgi:Protein of unknown function (DUF402)